MHRFKGPFPLYATIDIEVQGGQVRLVRKSNQETLELRGYRAGSIETQIESKPRSCAWKQDCSLPQSCNKGSLENRTSLW